MNEPTATQIGLLQHTLGINEHRREPYRNHFVASPGHHDMKDLVQLEAAGLMTRGHRPGFLPGDSIVFYTTEAGRVLAITSLPDLHVLTKAQSRYEHYRDVSECYDSFAAFLGISETSYEERDNTGWPEFKRVREYRMYRGGRWDSYSSDLKGDWALTKKEAKASYKAALKARQERERAALRAYA
ncbi:hypothetical protein Tamer19_17570 [Cupriavidus sp. TA19]|uniref:hypothetical protein n=1 Tax=Cupriavidus sp. TA19 TaxID=701108 RepID=UPI0027293FB8|nr:hypothetical protein [Cupriavidus sp. TA19]GLC92349.1 hypothetical protein Tamer19_17570 [Cupriavidus sp. TA19]